MDIAEDTPDNATLSELGRRMSLVRKQQRLSQEQLAKDAGVGVATLRRIEDGRDAQLGSWIKLLRALGMTHAINTLLPESFSSPMAEARARNKSAHAGRQGKAVWGDEL